MGYYAVGRGRRVGVFTDWGQCHAQVDKFPGARYKKFGTLNEAQQFVHENADAASKIELPCAPQQVRIVPAAPVAAEGVEQPTRVVEQVRVVPAAAVAVEGVEQLTREGGHVVVYTDGSALGNGRAGSRAGVGVFWGFNHPWNVGAPLDGLVQTNQRAELQAAITAIEQWQARATNWPLDVRTDSKYTIKAMTEWVPRWEARGENGAWKTTTGRPPDNEDLLRRLAGLCRDAPRPVRWVCVHPVCGARAYCDPRAPCRPMCRATRASLATTPPTPWQSLAPARQHSNVLTNNSLNAFDLIHLVHALPRERVCVCVPECAFPWDLLICVSWTGSERVCVSVCAVL